MLNILLILMSDYMGNLKLVFLIIDPLLFLHHHHCWCARSAPSF
uniref:Uncharacterized protein n=1 Tax=Rhizophora mucronata TaxID=61149 RepID=A0A2P2NGG6_RHIMU